MFVAIVQKSAIYFCTIPNNLHGCPFPWDIHKIGNEVLQLYFLLFSLMSVHYVFPYFVRRKNTKRTQILQIFKEIKRLSAEAIGYIR